MPFSSRYPFARIHFDELPSSKVRGAFHQPKKGTPIFPFPLRSPPPCPLLPLIIAFRLRSLFPAPPMTDSFISFQTSPSLWICSPPAIFQGPALHTTCWQILRIIKDSVELSYSSHGMRLPFSLLPGHAGAAILTFPKVPSLN